MMEVVNNLNGTLHDKMETLQILPHNILQDQVCQECFQYLSVPPITINSQGETICGRCIGTSNDNCETMKYTKSYFNIIAQGYSFKCTNHLDGCDEVLSLSETAEHEEKCIYKRQHCFFCSFSGNLCQILNHSVNFHREKVSFDAKISFFFTNETFSRSMMLIINDNIFHAVFNLSEELFSVVISPITLKTQSKVLQYGIRFFKSDDPTNINYIHTDYGLLNNNMETYFQKSREEFVTFFGLDVNLHCEILLEQFSLSVKELEFKQRYAKLRQSEEQLTNSRQQFQACTQQLTSLEAAMNIIKKMSENFFQCHSCEKIIYNEIYFCSKNHGCCPSCLKNFCKTCKYVQEFSKHRDIENFVIPCDWQDCKAHIFLKDYLQHKSECLQRPYKCPLFNCHEVLLSSRNLIGHWHCAVPRLTEEEQLEYNIGTLMEYYWLIKNDLYRVLIKFNKDIVQVLINEVDVLPNNGSFTVEGFVQHINQWENIESLTFCSKFEINIRNKISIRGVDYLFSKLCISYV